MNAYANQDSYEEYKNRAEQADRDKEAAIDRQATELFDQYHKSPFDMLWNVMPAALRKGGGLLSEESKAAWEEFIWVMCRQRAEFDYITQSMIATEDGYREAS